MRLGLVESLREKRERQEKEKGRKKDEEEPRGSPKDSKKVLQNENDVDQFLVVLQRLKNRLRNQQYFDPTSSTSICIQ